MKLTLPAIIRYIACATIYVVVCGHLLSQWDGIPTVAPEFSFSQIDNSQPLPDSGAALQENLVFLEESQTGSDTNPNSLFLEQDNYFPTVPEHFQASVVDSLLLTANEGIDAKHRLTQPWWVGDLDNIQEMPNGWQLDDLIWLAVENSPYVQSLLIAPQIEQTRAVAELGQFDPNSFVESILHDTSDPVGNTLTTGGASRFNEHFWQNRIGVKNKSVRGTLTEFAQEIGMRDNNSTFFVPTNQADTKLLLRYTKPLMRGAGKDYNQSPYVIAGLIASGSASEASQSIQQHAYTITEAYWNLFVARAQRQQIERGLERIKQVRDRIQARSDLDALRNQVLGADATLSSQQANLARVTARIRKAEVDLRASVAAPELQQHDSSAIVPITPTSDWKFELSPGEELQSALTYHPKVQAIQASLKAARVRLDVAENELRPTLNLVLEGYLRGLNGDFDISQSVADQFSKGAPSYSAGLSYARPYRNTAAKAILRERRLQLRQLLLDLDNTLLTIGANVESAIANVDAAYQELDAAVRATLATHAEVEYLLAQWENAYLDRTQTNLILDQLLDAQTNLIAAENQWAEAQGRHMIAMASLRLATGSLLPVIDTQ
ncbi:MAG: TolC family protein [Planctomycetales bacterium]|nr:TolC family protein [Planctomycetales bacterium]